MAKVDRKLVSWRVGERKEKELLNNWLDNQKNIQDSVSNVILHFINRYGNADVTDYEVQKMLFSDTLGRDNNIRNVNSNLEVSVEKVNEPNEPKETEEKEEKEENGTEVTEVDEKVVNNDDEDDMWNNLSKNDLTK